MKISEILKERLDSKPYTGFCPETIYEINGTPLGWETMEPLKKIPPPQSAEFSLIMLFMIVRFEQNSQ